VKNGNRATAKGAEGGKKRKEVMKIGGWEDGKKGILPVCLRQGFLGIYHLVSYFFRYLGILDF